jgi:hypothetical protein
MRTDLQKVKPMGEQAASSSGIEEGGENIAEVIRYFLHLPCIWVIKL